jgi:hypothetical protein
LFLRDALLLLDLILDFFDGVLNFDDDLEGVGVLGLNVELTSTIIDLKCESRSFSEALLEDSLLSLESGIVEEESLVVNWD